MGSNNENAIAPLVIFQVGMLYRLIHKQCDKLFQAKEFPLEMDQIPVLMALYFKGKSSQQEISTSLFRDKASVNRTVALLLKMELVEVVPDKIDKRRTLVELTAEGKKLAKEATAMLEEFDDSLSSVLTPGVKSQFLRIINALTGSMTKP